MSKLQILFYVAAILFPYCSIECAVAKYKAIDNEEDKAIADMVIQEHLNYESILLEQNYEKMYLYSNGKAA